MTKYKTVTIPRYFLDDEELVAFINRAYEIADDPETLSDDNKNLGELIFDCHEELRRRDSVITLDDNGRFVFNTRQ